MLAEPGRVSRETVVRFGIVLAVMGLWFALTKQEISPERITSTMNGAALMTCFYAMILREPFLPSHLNRWDEMVAYLGLGVLAHALA